VAPGYIIRLGSARGFDIQGDSIICAFFHAFSYHLELALIRLFSGVTFVEATAKSLTVDCVVGWQITSTAFEATCKWTCRGRGGEEEPCEGLDFVLHVIL